MAARRKPKADFCYTEGDTGPELGGKITDDNGAVDLTGYTVELAINRDGNYQNNLVKTAIINTPATLGEYTIEWASTDLVCGEGQEAVIRLTDPSNKVITYKKFIIDVFKKIEV